MPVIGLPPQYPIASAVFVKTITSGILRYNGAIVFIGKIINPRPGGDRISYNKFKTVFGKIAVFFQVHSDGILL
jgi:hypothetical protein